MTQIIIVGLVFLVALGYIGRLIYSSIHSKSCTTGCAKCGAIDLNKIEKAIREKDMLLH